MAKACKVIDFDRSRQLRKDAGLMRTAKVGAEPARTLRNLFANLRGVERAEVFAADPQREVEAARLRIDRTEGHGSTELYRLAADLYVIALDIMFDDTREEIVAGEGLVEFHICLRGSLSIQFPGGPAPILISGPSLLVLHQPVGFDATEILTAGSRLTGVSVYCRPGFLDRLVRHNGINERGLLEGIGQTGDGAWYRQMPLSCGLNYAASSLLQSPYRNGVRMLHAEAKVLEIMCEVLSCSSLHPKDLPVPAGTTESRQLDRARHILCTTFSPVPSVSDVARAVAMSPSKLKREFYARFGQTVFDCGLEARMRHAFELLRSQRMTICQVAYAVGYQHQTSFTAAFRRHFGVAPRDACREDMV